MKAIICTKYGSADVLQSQEIDKPVPKDNEVLIKIHASSVTTADTMMRTGKPYIGRLFIGLFKPKNQISGTGFAGVVETKGKGVTLFEEGDAVFGEVIFGMGTNAEYVCVAEDGVLTKKPENMSYAEAAPVCDGLVTALNFLRDVGNIKKGQKVLINGASGSVGSAAVQIAKLYGAEVTGVCSRSNIEMVKSLGADKVIDYTQVDFTETGETYDIIFDTVGKTSFSRCKKALTKKGTHLSTVLSLPILFHVFKTALHGDKKAKFSATGIRPLVELRTLLNEIKIFIEHGKVNSIIDKHYSLEQISVAHRYIEKGHKKGNVVLVV